MYKGTISKSLSLDVSQIIVWGSGFIPLVTNIAFKTGAINKIAEF